MATLTKRKYKSGKWSWEIRYPDPKTGKRKTKTYSQSFSKKHIKLIKKKIETELAERKESKSFRFLKKDKQIMVSEWFNQYIAEIPADKSLSTINRYERVFKQFNLAIGDIPINLMKPSIVKNWRKVRLASGCSQTTVNLEHRHLKACFNQAIKDEDIPIEENPFTEVDMYKIPKKLPKIMPAAHAEQFFKYIKKLSETPYTSEQKRLKNKVERAKKDYAYFLQLYYTGMRPNEPLKFKWENLSGNIVSIPNTKENQERQKYLHPEVMNLLEPKKSGKIFDNVVGVDSAGKRFKKYIKKADLPEKYTMYWFRHTFITRALKSGKNTKLVSEAVGHTSTKVTEEIYTHLQFNDTVDVINSIPKLNLKEQQKEN